MMSLLVRCAPGAAVFRRWAIGGAKVSRHAFLSFFIVCELGQDLSSRVLFAWRYVVGVTHGGKMDLHRLFLEG